MEVGRIPVTLLHWLMFLLLLLFNVYDVSNSFAPSPPYCQSGSLSAKGTVLQSVRSVLPIIA